VDVPAARATSTMVHFLFSLMSSVPFGSVNVFYIIPDKKPFVKPAFLVKCEQLPFIKLLFFSKISNFKASYGKFVSGFSKKRTAFSLEPWKTLDFTDINFLLLLFYSQNFVTGSAFQRLCKASKIRPISWSECTNFLSCAKKP